MSKKLFLTILIVSSFFVPFKCFAQINSTAIAFDVSDDMLHVTSVTDTQARNLQKLCKVWGFTKYTHMAFLTGEKDWDEELLTLIPIIQSAEENDVNDLLYNWFINLGDDGYNLDGLEYFSYLQENYKDIPECYDLIKAFFTGRDDFDWSSLRELNKELWLLTTGYEINIRKMADVSWINDEYLGSSLASVLSRFHEIQVTDRSKAPVSFNPYSGGVISNEKSYVDMDYSDSDYRLLGLFRLWNAIEYYFPYMDILDDDWSELLFTYIPEMMEGVDMLSYDLTLAALTSRLHDGHIGFYRGSSPSLYTLYNSFESVYGTYFAPVSVIEAEGYLVVNEVALRYRNKCLLLPGDVVLRLNGIDIDEIIRDMLQYISYPNDEKALFGLLSNHIILRQKQGNIPMKIDVLRNDIELSFDVDTVYKDYKFISGTPVVSASNELLENNIGLINPSALTNDEIFDIMQKFTNTNGLIIDLRQYPSQEERFLHYKLAEYILDEKLPFVIMSKPSISIPGIFIDDPPIYSGSGRYRDIFTQDHDISFKLYFYSNNVVILMNEGTMSNAEFAVMSLRNGSNVTIMGSNSIGADGDITWWSLPGGVTMWYTGFGVYTPEGTQTQRIGLSPDIYVERTIAGIRDGKDELIEAAIQFLIRQLERK